MKNDDYYIKITYFDLNNTEKVEENEKNKVFGTLQSKKHQNSE